MKMTVKDIKAVLEQEGLADDAPVMALGGGGHATNILVAKGCAGLGGKDALIVCSDGTED